ncbi:hypothetical protein GW846_03745 [Candidatus Gracilibacteria bacterium]|nr:hypothetical protein [Candidatus Gracilibacteria bacterium]
MKTLERDWQQITQVGIKEINFDINPKLLGIRDAFNDDVNKILSEQGKVKRAGTNRGVDGYEDFIQTTNGNIIINPKIEVKNGIVNILEAQIGKYETYHAFNNLRSGNKNGIKSLNLQSYKYEVLSAGGIFYDPEKESFYLYKRPDNSQEAAGQIDIIGGCMNTKDGITEEGKIDPAFYTASRLSSKGGIDITPDTLQFMGVQKFQKRGFQNLVYLAVLEPGISEQLNFKNVSEIPLSQVEQYMSQDNPGGAGLSIILSHPMFCDNGYGPEIMKDRI